MTPLRITATLHGAICLPGSAIALDALLMAAEAQRRGLDPPATPADCVEIEIPIAKDRGIYLASSGTYEVEQREGTYTNRRFPIEEAQAMGHARFKRIQLGAGPTKSYRIPREHMHLVGDRMTWFAIGSAAGVEALLPWVPYLGRRRAVGLGRVRDWAVEPGDTWDGFPVLRHGLPLRPLPVDWPGLAEDAERAYVVPSPPYWDHARRQECAVPSW